MGVPWIRVWDEGTQKHLDPNRLSGIKDPAVSLRWGVDFGSRWRRLV